MSARVARAVDPDGAVAQSAKAQRACFRAQLALLIALALGLTFVSARVLIGMYA